MLGVEQRRLGDETAVVSLIVNFGQGTSPYFLSLSVLFGTFTSGLSSDCGNDSKRPVAPINQ